MKYRIGQLVREGGPAGPISRIIGYENGKYHLELDNGNAHGWLEEEYLRPYRPYEQISLFESQE